MPLEEEHPVLVTYRVEECNVALFPILEESKTSTVTVGFDCEWDSGRYWGMNSKVALIQISTSSFTLLVQVFKMNQLPESIKLLLFSPSIRKVGRQVGGDIEKVLRDFNVADESKGIVELGSLCSGLEIITDGRAKLSTICEKVLGLCLPKDPEVRESKWSADRLTPSQVTYAALDSFISRKIICAIEEIVGNPYLIGQPLKSDYIQGMPVSIISGSKEVALGKTTRITIEDFKKSFKGHYSKKVIVQLTEILVPSFKLQYQEKKTLSACSNGELVCVDLHQVKYGTSLPIALPSPIEPTTTPLISPEVEEVMDNGFIYSRVLQDIFHVMDSFFDYIPLKHSLAKDFMFSLRDAIFVFDEEDLNRVQVYLTSIGEAFDSFYARNSDWILKRVKRFVPPPQELYRRVSLIFDFYCDQPDATTGAHLFSNTAKQEAEKFLQKILTGCLSDPPGESLYFRIKYDKNGLPIYRCCRGTNSTESMHSNIMVHFSAFNCSPRFIDVFLADFRQVHNLNVQRLNIPGSLNFVHYDTWLIDKLQYLSRKLYDNSDLHLFKSWVNSYSFEHTGEEFGIMKMNAGLKEDLKIENYNPGITESFICKLQKVSKIVDEYVVSSCSCSHCR